MSATVMLVTLLVLVLGFLVIAVVEAVCAVRRYHNTKAQIHELLRKAEGEER